jgi:hypothetical protein
MLMPGGFAAISGAGDPDADGATAARRDGEVTTTSESLDVADDDVIVPVRAPLDADSVIEPSNPMRRSRKNALSGPLYGRYARASVSSPDGVSTRAERPVESTATTIGRWTEPHMAGVALSTR